MRWWVGFQQCRPWSQSPRLPPPPLADDLPAGWSLSARPSDLGLSRWHKRWVHVAGALRLAARAVGAEAVVICTSNVEVLVVAGFARVGLIRGPVIAYDLLTPSSRRFDPVVNWLMGGIDIVAAIRRREIASLPRRFPALAGKVRFVPFPIRQTAPLGEETDDGFFYCAGSAHRDWDTAFRAFAQVDARFVVASPGPFPTEIPPNVQIVGALSPSAGERYLAHSRAAVVPFRDTELPHGPLIILDAMALGKPVVATRTAGSEDYVFPESGLLVAPGDVEGLIRGLSRLALEPLVAREMGVAARVAAAELTPRRVVAQLAAIIDSVRT